MAGEFGGGVDVVPGGQDEGPLVRARVPPYTVDRFFAPDIEAAKRLVISGQLRTLPGEDLFTS